MLDSELINTSKYITHNSTASTFAAKSGARKVRDHVFVESDIMAHLIIAISRSCA
jgi:hypothetical protein